MPSSFNDVVPNGKISFISMIEFYIPQFLYLGFLDGSDGKESISLNARDPTLIPQLGWCPRKGNNNPLQYPCLENWRIPLPGKSGGYSPWDCKESYTTERLTHMYIYHNFFIHLIKIFPYLSCHKYCCNEHGCAYIFSNKYFVSVYVFLKSLHRSWLTGSNTSSISISNNCIKYNKIPKNNFNIGSKRPVCCK